MTLQQFERSLEQDTPPSSLPPAVEALWWDAKGDWARAHLLVNELESADAMAVHAYLHRKEGDEWNANYWYRRAGEQYRRSDLKEEWRALLAALVQSRASSPLAHLPQKQIEGRSRPRPRRLHQPNAVFADDGED